MKKIFAIFLFFLICSPAYAGVKSFMEKCLDSWVGYSLDSLIAKWGYPNDEKEIAGKHLYIWQNSKTGYVPQTSTTYGNVNTNANYYGNSIYGIGNYNSTTTTYGCYSINYYCTRTIEVDSEGNIISWQWEGNNCPGTYIRGKAWVNPKNDEWARKKEEKRQTKSKNTVQYEYNEGSM